MSTRRGWFPVTLGAVEWNPEAPDQSPFWPGNAEQRGPRWVPIFVSLGVVIVVLVGLIWWLGRGDDDITESTIPDDSGDSSDSSDSSDPADPDDTNPTTSNTDNSGDSADDGNGSTSTTTTSTSSTSTTTVAPTTTTITTVPPENPSEFGPPTLSVNSTISTVGLDTVHFGMTIAQAQQAAGTSLLPSGPIGSCYHVVPHGGPEGVVFLVHNGTIERVDINSGPITTRSGVGVGSPEAQVVELFGDSIERAVRDDGTVDLVFVPSDPGDRNYRVVFNVSEGQVRAFKSGRLPQVMLDTGCESPAPA